MRGLNELACVLYHFYSMVLHHDTDRFEEALQHSILSERYHTEWKHEVGGIENLTDRVGLTNILRNRVYILVELKRYEEARELLTSFIQQCIPEYRARIANKCHDDGQDMSTSLICLRFYLEAVRPEFASYVDDFVQELYDDSPDPEGEGIVFPFGLLFSFGEQRLEESNLTYEELRDIWMGWAGDLPKGILGE